MAHSDFIFLCHFCLVYKLCLWLRQTDNVKENTPYLNEKGWIWTCAILLERTLPSYWKKKGNSYLQLTSFPPGASRQLGCRGQCPGVRMERQKCEFQFSSRLLGHMQQLPSFDQEPETHIKTWSPLISHLSAMSLWEDFVSSQGLSFLICKLEVLKRPQPVASRIKWAPSTDLVYWKSSWGAQSRLEVEIPGH